MPLLPIKGHLSIRTQSQGNWKVAIVLKSSDASIEYNCEFLAERERLRIHTAKKACLLLQSNFNIELNAFSSKPD